MPCRYSVPYYWVKLHLLIIPKDKYSSLVGVLYLTSYVLTASPDARSNKISYQQMLSEFMSCFLTVFTFIKVIIVLELPCRLLPELGNILFLYLKH